MIKSHIVPNNDLDPLKFILMNSPCHFLQAIQLSIWWSWIMDIICWRKTTQGLKLNGAKCQKRNQSII